MQWDASPQAGFTAPEATPWLPPADDYRARNVAAQDDDPASMLNFFRRLTELRRAEPALNRGDIEVVKLWDDQVLVYRRTLPGHDCFLVALNFGQKSYLLDLWAVLMAEEVTFCLSTDKTRVVSKVEERFGLWANEGVVLRYKPLKKSE